MIRKLRVIFTRTQKIKFLILFGILFVGSLLEFLGVSLVLPFVQLLMEPEGTSHLFGAGLLLIAVYIVKNGYLLLMKTVELRFIFNNRLELSGRLMRSYMEKPYAFHLQKNSSEVLQNVTFEVNKLYDLILYGMELVSDLLIILMLSVYLFVKDPLITLVVVVLLGGCSLFYFKGVQKRTKCYGQQNQIYNSRMLQAIHQAMGGIKEIKLLSREAYFVRAYEENGRRYAFSLKRSQLLQYLPKYLIETICVCGVLGVVLIRLCAGAEVEKLVPELSVFAVAAFRLLPSVNQVNRLLNNILFLAPCVGRIYEDIQRAEARPRKSDPSKSAAPLPPADKISFRDVSFAYPGSSEKILSHVDVEIPVGSSVGFVGTSGAGKTTLVDLFLGLLCPDGGGIFYGDRDIRDYKASWGQKLGYIPQNIYLADDTIRRNIAFGIPDSMIDEEQVWKAVREAQMEAFVKGLPEGLDTPVGEAGVRLSGGQRQRIGIARALYQEPEILVLDEATSALDTQTERAVMEAVEHLRGTCTLLMIAHRTSTLEGCDRIYQVKDQNLQIVY